MSKSSDRTSLGDRLKGYESDYEILIDPKNHIVVRLDCHKFSKFTKGFNIPFDEVLHKTMIETTKDLFEEFRAVTGYTQSDEITLVIPSNAVFETEEADFPNVDDGDICINRETQEETTIEWEELYSDREDRTDVCYFGDNESYERHIIYGRNSSCQEHTKKRFKQFNDKYKFLNVVDVKNNQIYNGRVQKIASLAAAFCTMRFSVNFSTQIDKLKTSLWNSENVKRDNPEDYDKYKKRVKFLSLKENKAYFDARVFGVDSDEETYNAVMWSVMDAFKNAKSTFSQTYISHKRLKSLNGLEQAELILKETGNDFNKMPESFKYGTFIKKEKYMKKVDTSSFDGSVVKGMVVKMPDVERTRLIELIKPMTSFSEDNVKFVMSKTI